MHKRERLSLRIPWLLEAVAEGPQAIIALVTLEQSTAELNRL